MKKISKQDSELFRESIRHIKILHPKEKNILSPLKLAKADHLVQSNSEKKLLDNIGESSVTAEQSLFFAKSGLQSRLIRKLKRGEFPLEATLDLHGLTIDQARETVKNFMRDTQKAGFRCVKIIHGKSRLKTFVPKIKNHVNQWIRQYSSVLAFTSAQPKDGGTGAIYILLQKHISQ